MASSIVIGAASSVVREGEIIRSWFDNSVGSSAGQVFMPEALARDVLVSSAALFGWDPERTDLRYSQQIDGPTSHSVRFVQHFKGVPVDPAEVVVNMFKDGRVYSILNQYRYDIPEELDPGQVKITLRRAETVVARLVGDRGHRLEGSGRLIIYRYERDDNHPPTAERPAPRRSLLAAPGRRGTEAPAHEEGTYFLAWDFEVLIDEPQRDLRVLIDAMTGDVINVIDLAKYANGTSSVFDPNPVVTSGNTSLSWGSPTATLNGQRVPVMVDNLDPKDSTNNFHLDGSHVHMEEFELPTVAEPVSATGDFTFGFSDDTFLDAMAYFHIDRFQSYIQGTLGLTRDSVARPVRRRRARAETAVPEPGLLRPRGTAMTRCWSTPTCSAWPRCRPRPGTCVSSRGASWPACISTASSGSGKRPRKELGEYSVARSMRLRIEHYVEGRAGPYLG